MYAGAGMDFASVVATTCPGGGGVEPGNAPGTAGTAAANTNDAANTVLETSPIKPSLFMVFERNELEGCADGFGGIRLVAASREHQIARREQSFPFPHCRQEASNSMER